MHQLFNSLKGLIKPKLCITDNIVFRLHYRTTVVILLAFSIMVTAQQYFGDPISCITKRNIPANLLDSYCWIHSTFSIENSWNGKVGVDIPYPGVDNSKEMNAFRVYHTYYQWVCFFLFIQAIFFYLPHLMWKTIEGGLIRNLILGLDKPIVKSEDLLMNIDLLSDYLRRSFTMHKKLFFGYILSEILNLINVLVQMLMVDTFLGGQFFNYGWSVLQWNNWSWPLNYNPMIQLFPRLTKCEFFQYGPSAGIERFDTMCLLPVNILNEKLYIFMWFWFYSLTIVSIITVVYRLLMISFLSTQTLAIFLNCRTLKRNKITNILQNGNIGDWFLLYLLSKNIDPLNFHDLMLHLEIKIKNKILSNHIENEMDKYNLHRLD